MRIGRNVSREPTQVPLTSFMDMMFLLLIFFMVTTSFQQETRAIDITLPRAENPRVMIVDESVLTITVSRDDRFFLNDTEVEPRKFREELRKAVKTSGFKHVIVKGDSNAKYQSIAAVIDALTTVNVDGISFAVLYGGV